MAVCGELLPEAVFGGPWSEGMALMGAGLLLLQGDLILESVRVDMEQNEIARVDLL